jgi:hypothetical protein
MQVDVDTAVFNPASIFKTPDEILRDEKIALTPEQKLRALQTWKLDIQLRRTAEEENMHSNQDDQDVALEEKILAALNSLRSFALPISTGH